MSNITGRKPFTIYLPMPPGRMMASLLMAAVGICLPARAATIFNNIVGNDGGSYGIFGSRYVAGQFTPQADIAFTAAQVEIVNGGAPSSFNMALYSDFGGVPGALVEQFGTSLSEPNSPNVVAASSTVHPTLSANVPYWLILSASDDGAQAYWLTGGAANVPIAVYDDGVWTPGVDALQFRIDGDLSSEVPEPANTGLVVVLLTGLGIHRLCQRTRRVARHAQH